MRRHDGDRGAAAVELALVLPVLLLLVMGIVDFGIAYNRQVSLSGGAREGVRWLALHPDDSATARDKTVAAGPMQSDGSPLLASSDVAMCTAGAGSTCTPTATATPTCTAGSTAYVIASNDFDISIPFGPQLTVTLRGKAVMRCGG
jgi:Flp pilus assembly protein TadG